MTNKTLRENEKFIVDSLRQMGIKVSEGTVNGENSSGIIGRNTKKLVIKDI